MAAAFELITNAHGLYLFRLLSGTGEVLAESRPYLDKGAACAAIASTRQSAPTAPIIDHAPGLRRSTMTAEPADRGHHTAPSRWFG